MEKPSKTTVFTVVFEGWGLQDLLQIGDIRYKYALPNRSEFYLRFFPDFAPFLDHFGAPFGPLFASSSDFGRLLGDFGRLSASTWGLLGAAWTSKGAWGAPGTDF